MTSQHNNGLGSVKQRGFLARLADARVALGAFALLLIAAVWGMALYQIAQSKSAYLALAERDARNLAHLFEEHATRTIEVADQTVIYLRHRYLVAGRTLDVATELSQGLNSDNIYALFTIVDENADVILSSKPFQPVNLRDREHIQVQMQATEDRLFISKPVLGRVSKKWTIQMTRRIATASGALRGVVVVSMDPAYFTRLYGEIDVGQFGVVSLVGEDGVVRTRRSGDSQSLGQSQLGSALFEAMQAKGTGTVRTVSSIDGRERIYAYAHLNQYPIYAVVGIDVEERLAGFYTGRTQTIQLAAISTLVLVLFTAGLILVIGRLIKSRAQAIAANRAKSRFLANMSHELRTPLNGILGYSDLLIESLEGKAYADYARAIHTSGERLLGLVDDVLLLSALESNSAAVTLRREPLRQIAELAVALHRPAAAAKGLMLSWHVQPQAPDTLQCDRANLLRALHPLLENAIRYTHAGAVELSIDADDKGVLFQVRDTGCGISAEHQRRIFDNFTQADDSPTRAAGGAGLGLAIAAKLVHAMGGKLALESEVDKGTRFFFHLPAGKDSAEPASRLEASEQLA